MSLAYYNENDPFAAEWLRNLIAENLIVKGEVDERSIWDVYPSDIVGYTQHHWFAGIGGWSFALRLAGWPDNKPVWTGSVPCQPYSQAGKRKGTLDERHLWPAFFYFISELQPSIIFGEQVEAAIQHGWLDLVACDLEGIGYTFGAAVLPAASIKAPHIRSRVWFVAYANQQRCTEYPLLRQGSENYPQTPWNSEIDPLADSDHKREKRTGIEEFQPDARREIHYPRDYLWLSCSDGKYRQIPTESILQSLVDGVPQGMVDLRPESGFPLTSEEIKGRSYLLKGIGNAIVPQVAEKFIRSILAMEIGL